MNRIKIENSGNIAEIGYDYDTMTMEVKFVKGGLYKYWPITQNGFEGFRNSESKGKYFHKYIKANPKINFEKITDLQSDA